MIGDDLARVSKSRLKVPASSKVLERDWKFLGVADLDDGSSNPLMAFLAEPFVACSLFNSGEVKVYGFILTLAECPALNGLLADLVEEGILLFLLSMDLESTCIWLLDGLDGRKRKDRFVRRSNGSASRGFQQAGLNY